MDWDEARRTSKEERAVTTRVHTSTYPSEDEEAPGPSGETQMEAATRWKGMLARGPPLGRGPAGGRSSRRWNLVKSVLKNSESVLEVV